MPPVFETAPDAKAIPITFASNANWEAIKTALPAEARQFAEANGFAAKPGKCLILPAPDGAIAQVIFGIEDEGAKSRDPFRAGALPLRSAAIALAATARWIIPRSGWCRPRAWTPRNLRG
jgi:leucyl aminopeptidase